MRELEGKKEIDWIREGWRKRDACRERKNSPLKFTAARIHMGGNQ
jgi:hypothetical protein